MYQLSDMLTLINRVYISYPLYSDEKQDLYMKH